MTRLWWVRLPLAARHLSSQLALALTNGLYLATHPRIAALASPIALLVGLVAGWRHWGYQYAVSESLGLLLLAIGLGTLSGHLGAFLVAGFALGDFVLGRPGWSGPPLSLAQQRLPLLIQYGLLGTLAVSTPVVTKLLLASIVPPPRLDRQVRVLLAAVGQVLLTAALVYWWVLALPVLIRPLYTWRGLAVPVAAFSSEQQALASLLGVAVVAALVRLGLQATIAADAAVLPHLEALRRDLAAVDRPRTDEPQPLGWGRASATAAASPGHAARPASGRP